MRTVRRAVAVSGALLVLLAGCGDPTESTQQERAHGQDMPQPADRTWAVHAHQGNLAEIAVGNQAKARGASKEVRAIGSTLVSDHSGADTLLRQAASKARLGMPLRPDAAQRAEAAKLSGAKGAKFDQEFVRSQIAAHRTAIAQAQTEVRRGGSVTMRRLAQQSLPTLKKHLWMLQQVHT